MSYCFSYSEKKRGINSVEVKNKLYIIWREMEKSLKVSVGTKQHPAPVFAAPLPLGLNW